VADTNLSLNPFPKYLDFMKVLGWVPQLAHSRITLCMQEPLEPHSGFRAVRKNGRRMTPQGHLSHISLTCNFGGGAIQLRTAQGHQMAPMAFA
jgi:hypothetical protein